MERAAFKGDGRNHGRGLASALALGTIALSGCGGERGGGGVAPSLPRLAVAGTEIVGAATGAPVTLRGFVFSAGVWYDVPAGSSNGDLANLQFMQSEADFQQIAGWGANLAILYLNYRWFDDPSGYAFIDQVAGWCRAHDVYLLPSLVVYPGGGPRGGQAFFGSPTLEAQAEQFWVDFVTRYKDHPEFVGYDLLNEPQGVSVDEIVAFQTTLIDAVRGVDPNAVVFVEPQWGDPTLLTRIDRAGLVYDPHVYLPLYFTSQLFPWMYGGAVPGGLHYPATDGSMVTNIVIPSERSQVYDPSVPAGTYDWQTLTTSYAIPAGSDLAFVKLFSNGDVGATVYFDDIEASVDGGPFTLIPNGSFETVNEVSTDANYWSSYVADAGTVTRTNEAAADGQWSAKISGSDAWSDYTTHYGLDADNNSIFYLGTAAGVPVAGATALALRWRVKAENASAATDGLEVMFGEVQKKSYTEADLDADLDGVLATNMAGLGAPILIGEFTPSLAGTRPDILDWTSALMTYANAHGISWAYYLYRDDWTGTRYLGLYNGPYGAPTDYGTADADILARVQAGLTQ
jgi:Cellulase (glycosyl hydrolase family 5)